MWNNFVYEDDFSFPFLIPAVELIRAMARGALLCNAAVSRYSEGERRAHGHDLPKEQFPPKIFFLKLSLFVLYIFEKKCFLALFSS